MYLSALLPMLLVCFHRSRLTSLVFVLYNVLFSFLKPSVFEWFDLKNPEDEKELGGSVQLAVLASSNSGQQAGAHLDHYQYTHIVRVNIDRAENLEKLDVLKHGDPYVTVSWGSKKFRTKTHTNEANPEFGETVYFWANSDSQKGYKLKVQLLDEDKHSRDDVIGAGYVSAADMFEMDGESLEKWITLTNVAQKDRDLANVGNEEDGDFGRIRVVVTATRREVVEDEFFGKLIDTFDTSHDGILDVEEVDAMMEMLDVQMDEKQFEQFWFAVDPNGTGQISEDMAVKFMRSLLFISSDSANRVLSFWEQGMDRVFSQSLMRVSSTTKQSDIQIMDRQTGLVVVENIPAYIQIALRAMFNSRLGRLASRSSRAVKIMHDMSVRQGAKYDNPASVSELPAFIELHNIDLTEVEKDLDDYKTFNEFFYRRLKPGARPIADAKDPRIAVSAADCRLSVFQTVSDATRLWVKGSEFTIENFLGPVANELAPRFKNGSMAIFRLAPQDYHCWHVPVGGKLGRRTPIDGALYTVNPLAVRTTTNVYTQNKREVVEIESEEFGLVAMVCIGATMVGSINIAAEDGAVVEKGDYHGYFAFGGSTIICLFEEGAISFEGDLLANSNKQIETLVRVGTRLGVAGKK
jgi:phosphatidylserine decarboxylase